MFTNITDEDIDNADDSTDSFGDMPEEEEDTPKKDSWFNKFKKKAE